EKIKFIDAEHLAYIIFTSGSTGLPKGVMIDHRGALNTIVDINQRFGVNSNDRIIAISNLNFDLSVYDVFGSLNAGAALVIPNYEQEREPAYWVELIEKHQVSIWNTVPALMRMLTDYQLNDSDKNQPNLSSLRLVLLSGDWIPLDLPGQIKKLNPSLQLMSLGGATEASIWSIIYPIDSVEYHWNSIPYGKPLANQQFYVFNQALQHCPQWVTGDLYIAGVGLAKGYWKDDEKTQASFFNHPITGEALYRTGDMGRYLADGNIEFLGREDNQVKIQGYRIELGEIENILLQYPVINQALANVWNSVSGKQLVAYVIVNDALQMTELRDWLKQQLPEYMIPKHILEIAEIPLTANGKVDRNRLPEPQIDGQNQTNQYVAAGNSTEQWLVEVCEQLLNIEKIGIHDNFMEAGGSSLEATRLVTRVRQNFEIELSLRAFFEAPTIHQLSTKIHQSLHTNIPDIKRVSRDQSIQLSFAQERLWFIDQWVPGNPIYNLLMTARITNEIDHSALDFALTEIMTRHEVLRTTFVAINGEPRQRFSPPQPQKFIHHDLTTLEAIDQQEIEELLLRDEALYRFDLTNGPLLRGSCIQLNENHSVLMMNMHHIVSDGWSIGIIIHEFLHFYEAYVNQTESTLVDLPIQYADFAVWQKQWLSGDRLQSQTDYWRRHLANLSILNLPTDHPRPSVQSYAGKRHPLVIGNELIQPLTHLAEQQGATLFM
ncbi:MAG: amino acid adenylation domain-containing protein, partial [Methylococcales bacterium]|nr:amino acid adenylation domain-containing protein [Methylococcales bacterium]